MTRLALLALLGACSSVELAAPLIRGRVGPASGRAIKRVVAVPATCGSLGREPASPDVPSAGWRPARCPEDAVAGADETIRAALAFRGLDVIDSERVNAITAERRETRVRESSVAPNGVAQAAGTAVTTTTIGARWEDATPIDQAAILDELRADAVMTTRIWIGSSPGISMRRMVHAQVQLLATADRALVWSRRCEVEVGGLLDTDALAIQRAARCAVEAP